MGFDGSINIDSSIDGTGFTKGMGGISSAFSDGLGKLGGIAKTALGALTGIIGAAAGALGTAATAGVKYNSDMEQYTTSFTTMLGSAQKANDMVGNLHQLDLSSVLDMSSLAKSAKTLLSFGVSADSVTPTLKELSDVSQGNSDRFDALSLAFAQTTSAGKLMGQDLLQYVNAGFNPLQVISQKTGKSMSDLRDEMQKGQISAQDVADAFKTATSAGGQFFNSTEAQSKTFAGQMSILKGSAMQFLGELTAGLQNSLKDTALPMVNGWMAELQSAFASGGVQGVVAAAGNVLSEAVTAIAKQAPQMIGLAVTLVTTLLDGLNANAAELSTAGADIVAKLADGIISVSQSLGYLAINLIGGILSGLATALPGLAQRAISVAEQLVQQLAQGIENNAPAIASTAVSIISRLISGLLTMLNGAATAATVLTLPCYTNLAFPFNLTGSMSTKSGYATGAVTAAFQQAVQAAQVIANGNFANGTAGWVGNYGTQLSIDASGNLQIVGQSSNCAEVLQSTGSISLAGHRVWIRCYALLTNTVTNPNIYTMLKTSTGQYNAYARSAIVQNQQLKYCEVINVESNMTGTAQFGIRVQSDGGLPSVLIGNAAGIVVIDMGTDASNPLYSLTADQMSTLFPSYFSGTQTISVPRATVSVGNPSTFAEHGTPISSVQLAIPSGTSCQQYQIGLQVESGSTATGWVSPGAQGVVFYPAVGETGTITNTGNVDAYPVITVTGACANPTVTNDTTGETVAVNIALGTADTLVIDCRPATRGCYLNGALAFGIKQGLGWIHCPPGENILTFSRDGYDTKRHCAISLQGRYL